MRVGCHLSSSKGYMSMGKEALKISANTFQFFSRNPRGSRAKALDLDDISRYLRFAEENDIKMILAHAPYTLNLCSINESTRDFAKKTMADDLARLEHLGGCYYNFHPGSPGEQGTEAGIDFIADALNEIITADQSTTVLLETMSGKGSEVGGTFEELAIIIDKIQIKDHFGICLDTCHVFDGGYDIVSDLDGVLTEFDRIIGLNKLKAIHINDSLNTIASHKDRHAKIGEGNIGIEAFKRIINHPALRDLPYYLETPNDLPGYAREIALLRDMYE